MQGEPDSLGLFRVLADAELVAFGIGEHGPAQPGHFVFGQHGGAQAHQAGPAAATLADGLRKQWQAR
jgi:hypothetical protein